MKTRPKPLSYKQALQWIVDNDDTEWLIDGTGIASVTATLVADIYGRDVLTEVWPDLMKLLESK